VDNRDIKIETLARKREGMQPVTVWNDIRVTHLKTGIAVEIPHEFRRSQNGNLKVALAMLEEALGKDGG
jgi:protein subunit release factor A